MCERWVAKTWVKNEVAQASSQQSSILWLSTTQGYVFMGNWLEKSGLFFLMGLVIRIYFVVLY